MQQNFLRKLIFDEKTRALIIQTLVIGIFAVLIYLVTKQTAYNLEKRGIGTGFEFLNIAAGYDISISLIPYDSNDTHLRAYFVGLLNTLMIAVCGCFLATILGFLVGIIRLSSNWLFRNIAYVYVEFTRNVLVNELGMSSLMIGYDHRFGKNREASVEDLIRYGQSYNFEVTVIPAQDISSITVSSTKIRDAIKISNFNNDSGFTTNVGDITAVVAGTNLNGGATSGSATVNLDTALTGMTSADFSGNVDANFFVGTATQARYADLAEKYEADSDYEPGTVLVIGGDKEVTVTDEPGSYAVVGVVSTDPAYLMNSKLQSNYPVSVASVSYTHLTLPTKA